MNRHTVSGRKLLPLPKEPGEGLTNFLFARYTASIMISAVTTLSLRRRVRALGSAPATRAA